MKANQAPGKTTMNKASLALIKPHPQKLLVLLLALLCLVFSLNYLFSADPGNDGGSGIGGTGKFGGNGGDSGMGGTGGPVLKLGATDTDQRRHDDDQNTRSSATVQDQSEAGHNGSVELATAVLDVSTLKLTPPPVMPADPAGREINLPDNLDKSLARISLDTAQTSLPLTGQSAGRDSLQDSVAGIEDIIAADIHDTTQRVLTSSLEVTRQLMLAENRTNLTLAADTEDPVSIEVIGKRDDERRQRIAPAQRAAIPAPPVRPMRI